MMMMAWIQHAVECLWFMAGWQWAEALRDRSRVVAIPVPVEVERLTPVYQKVDAEVDALVKRSLLVGPGVILTAGGKFSVHGLSINCALTLDTDQMAAMPEIEARRGGLA